MELEHEFSKKYYVYNTYKCTVVTLGMTNIRYDYFRNLYTEILNKYFPVKERYARANPVLFKTKELNKVILKRSTPCNIFQNQTNYDGY